MSENRMAGVAKLLGVEIGEEFIAKCCHGNKEGRYRLTNSGLQHKMKNVWVTSYLLESILYGEYSVEKIPWRADKGQVFYIPVLRGCEKYQRLVAKEGIGEGYCENGLMCKTKDQAIEIAEAMINLARKMQGFVDEGQQDDDCVING